MCVCCLHARARARARTHTHTHTHTYIYIYILGPSFYPAQMYSHLAQAVLSHVTFWLTQPLHPVCSSESVCCDAVSQSFSLQVIGYIVFLHNAYVKCRSYRTCCHSKFGLKTLTPPSSCSKTGPCFMPVDTRILSTTGNLVVCRKPHVRSSFF